MRAADTAAVCRHILRQSGSSFSMAFNMLPRDQRDALTAFYAFCRKVDDAVDEARDIKTARRRLYSWKKTIADLAHRAPKGDPVSTELKLAVDRFGIDPQHLDLIVAGVEQDLDTFRYETFRDLYEYCYRVASAVGLVIITVLAGRSHELELYAELTGTGVQLTNVLRDIMEDAGRGRIYLPLEDLKAFGVPESDILERRMTRRLKKLLGFEAARARQYYDMAAAALPPDQRHRLFFAEALRKTYLLLLQRLVDNDFPVFHETVSIRGREKLAIAMKHRLHPATFLEYE